MLYLKYYQYICGATKMGYSHSNLINAMLNNAQKTIVSYLLAFVFGIILTFAFAPTAIFILAIIIPAFLFAQTLNVSPKKAFCLGFSFGLGFFGAGVYWVYISIHYIGEVPFLLSGLITFIFICILSLFPAFTLSISNRYFLNQRASRLLCIYPAIWVLLEWVRSWIFTGFLCFFLGYSQTNSPLKGFASLLGVYGISLAVLLTSSLCVYACLQYQARQIKYVYLSIA